MIIVVEGPDRTGKSTLCSQLSDRLNVPVFKPSGREPGDREAASGVEEGRALMNMLEHLDGDIIFDRFFPSEYAYGVANQRNFDLETLLELDSRLRALPHLCVQLSTRIADGYEEDDRHWRLVESAYAGWREISKCRWIVNTHKLVDSDSFMGWYVEGVMKEIVQRRPTKDGVFMKMAHELSRRSTCLSRRNGAVVVADGHVIATGYNGPPSGMPHPCSCARLTGGVPSGQGLEMCDDVHSEENCIAQAALHGHNTRGSVLYTIMSPCHRCWRMLLAAGVSEVVYEREYGDVRALSLPGISIRKMGE